MWLRSSICQDLQDSLEMLGTPSEESLEESLEDPWKILGRSFTLVSARIYKILWTCLGLP